jgi:ADP-heptose:LPS heptosyltransferase
MAEAMEALGTVGVETPYVALALGAMTATKRLGTEVWVGLIQHLRESGLAHVMLGAGREDEEQAAAILERMPGVPDLTGKLPLATTAGVIAQALALVGNDSSMSHIAAACGTPAVVAFGPTVPSATAPVGPKVRVIRREDLTCLECSLFECPVAGHPCMDAIPEKVVWEALVAFLLPR